MKKTIYTLLFALVPFVLSAQSTDAGKIDGDSAFVRGDYASAITIYENLLSGDNESVDIYYNLGNAYYKNGEIAKAVLNYERAALLRPGDKDIAFNLELARSKTVDKVTPLPRFFLSEWMDVVINAFNMQTWSNVAIIFFMAMLLTILLFLFGKNIAVRKISFFTAIFSLIITIFANIAAFNQYIRLTERNEAVIMQPSVTVKSTPGNSGTDLFVVNEGRKVTITDDSMQGWKEIELEDGNVGWIPTEVMERI